MNLSKGSCIMLKLSKICKRYTIGDNVVDALKGVDLEFRESEFVNS